ncbi:uncharacterized protein LOC129590045 [Paramacrobiotus metropolitanus]|uniref:uncharacterized protein LOC129590045 n=1 Tax=Paramacrobiotus metropolitanus TaxID=2943436 RepID=UPI00244656A4|nr:uncharacterized protein LOC129590045 [Paramacrobiotus metropolitanus]
MELITGKLLFAVVLIATVTLGRFVNAKEARVPLSFRIGQGELITSMRNTMHKSPVHSAFASWPESSKKSPTNRHKMYSPEFQSFIKQTLEPVSLSSALIQPASTEPLPVDSPVSLSSAFIPLASSSSLDDSTVDSTDFPYLINYQPPRPYYERPPYQNTVYDTAANYPASAIGSPSGEWDTLSPGMYGYGYPQSGYAGYGAAYDPWRRYDQMLNNGVLFAFQ